MMSNGLGEGGGGFEVRSVVLLRYRVVLVYENKFHTDTLVFQACAVSAWNVDGSQLYFHQP